jgi:putative endonuclease
VARAEQVWFCYMLRCSDGSLYVGSASDPSRRLKQHNQGTGARHTALRQPVILVWQERHLSEKAARAREAELKGWRREKKLKLIRAGNSGIADSGLHPSP